MVLPIITAGAKTSKFVVNVVILGLTLSLSATMVHSDEDLTALPHIHDSVKKNVIGLLEGIDDFYEDINGHNKNLHLIKKIVESNNELLKEKIACNNQKDIEFKNELDKLQKSIDGLSHKLVELDRHNTLSNNKTTEELKSGMGKFQESMDGLTTRVNVLNKYVETMKDANKKKMFYVDMTEEVPWNTAYDTCNYRNMRLASIQSQEEQDEMFRTIKATTDKKSIDFWISGKLNYLSNNFEWQPQGELLSYSNWRDGEPSKTEMPLNIREDCLVVEEHFNYKWNDLNCNTPRYFICEHK